MNIQIVFSILGALCLFGGAMAFAVGPLVTAIALDWYPKRKASFLNRIVGFFFGVRSYNDVMKIFSGGTHDEIRKRHDFNAPARGIIWTIIGTSLIITSLLIS